MRRIPGHNAGRNRAKPAQQGGSAVLFPWRRDLPGTGITREGRAVFRVSARIGIESQRPGAAHIFRRCFFRRGGLPSESAGAAFALRGRFRLPFAALYI